MHLNFHIFGADCGELAGNAVRTERGKKLELPAPRGFGPPIGEVDDVALRRAFDRGMRLLDEAFQSFRQPVIAASLAARPVHSLLHHDPAAIFGDHESMEVKIEPVLHGSAVDLRDQPAGGGKAVAVKADAFADSHQLVRRSPRMLAAPAADVEAELAIKRSEPALEGAEHARRDAGGLPVHPHHRAERLKPEWMREPAQELVPPVVVHDRLADHRPEPRHPVGEPFRDVPVVQRQVGAS